MTETTITFRMDPLQKALFKRRCKEEGVLWQKQAARLLGGYAGEIVDGEEDRAAEGRHAS